jgi:Flp pilus assembly protein TadG
MKMLLKQKGSILVLVAICLMMILAFLALVVDLGFGLTVKHQLRAAADAASLAAAAELDGTEAGIEAARSEAMAYAQKNRAAGAPLILLEEDIVVGEWDSGTRTLTSLSPASSGYPEKVNVVRVTARRDSTSQTALTTFFAQTLGISKLDVRAEAAALIGGPTQCLDSTNPAMRCNINVPIALYASELVDPSGEPECGKNLRISSNPNQPQSGTFTTFFQSSPSAVNLTLYVAGDSPDMYAVSCSSECLSNPPIDNHHVIRIAPGNYASVYVAMRAAYLTHTNPCNADTCEDADGDGTREWKSYVPVICANGGNTACVSGFARFNIEEVCAPPACNSAPGLGGVKSIQGFLKCGDRPRGGNPGGGGANYGTLSPLSMLVQ